MYKTIEATYLNGFFYPSEPLHVTPTDRVLLTVIPGGKTPADHIAHSARGAFRGRLSSVDEFIAAKAVEKALEI